VLANIKSAIKRMHQEEKRHMRNKAVKSEVKTRIKNFLKALESNNREEVEKLLREAVSTIDRAARKGVIHKNNAARKKSRLYAKLNQSASENR